MVFQIRNFVIGLSQTEIHKFVIDKYVMPRFRAAVGDPLYDSRVDLDANGMIDMRDITQFILNADLTFKRLGITPLLWYQVVLPLGFGLIGIAVLTIIFRKR